MNRKSSIPKASEQAPPAPPAMASSPELYMTPQLEKRRDGVCPSLLPLDDVNKSIKPHAGGLNKPYRTNSKLLLQVKDPAGNREAAELNMIVASVKKTIDKIVNPRADVIHAKFVPAGCTWKMELGPHLNGANETYRIETTIFANQVIGITNYVVDTLLVPKVPVDPNPLAPPLKGYRDAKQAFDSVSLQVRKSIVGLEFPEFPEGCKGRAFREVYQLNARLKSGSFATVCRGTHRATGRKVAIKCVLRKDLPPADDAAIYDEVAILASLNHPHIVPLIDFFDEKDCYFIVMELMSGGDLFDRIGKKKTYSEADARDLIVKMLKAVAYCHTRHIAHCDMKPKNLLLMSDDNDSFIKLADFGFAARVHESKSLTKQCGTPFFVSPEILMRKPYDQQSDMWSVGCIVFLLLSGNLPFMGRSQKELFRKIVAGKFSFDEEDWEGVSDHAKDLVSKLLVLDPDNRITAAEAIRHDWLKASRDRLSLVVLQGTSQRLKTFNARMKLRSAMIAVDWVSTLTRMSWSSNRNLSGGGNASSDAGEDKGAAAAEAPSSNPLLAAARKMKAKEESAQEGQQAAPSNGGESKPASSKTASSKPASSKPASSNPLLAMARKMKASKEPEESKQQAAPTGTRSMLNAAQAMKAMKLKDEKEKKDAARFQL